MKERELLLCQIHSWYPRFRSVSLKTLIHPLPEPFVSYLLQDGLFLPRSSQAMPSRTKITSPSFLSEDYHPWTDEDEEDDELDSPSFPELEEAIRASIMTLGGAVFPKLNWSAPKDTAWISSSGSLKCTNFGEIALLLKASDNLVHDLSHAFEACEDKTSDRPETFVLALRKWYDIRPEMEFRGFVREGLLVGISQREVTGFYPVLVESEEALESAIFRFFIQDLSEQFGLEDYTFDCYVTRDGRVKLVDFNPWGAFTLPLLFSWEELEENHVRLKLMLVEIEESTEKKDAEVKIANTLGAGDFTCLSKELCKVQEDSEREHGTTLRVASQSDSDNESTNSSYMAVGSIEDESQKEIPVAPCDSLNSLSTSDQETKDMASKEEEESGTPSTRADVEPCLIGKTSLNVKLRERGYKAEFRVVKSEGLVQPNLRLGGGVPFDYVNRGPGSAWDEFLRKADEELQQQMRDNAAGG